MVSERNKQLIEKYKMDRKAGKVKPMIPPSQRKLEQKKGGNR